MTHLVTYRILTAHLSIHIAQQITIVRETYCIQFTRAFNSTILKVIGMCACRNSVSHLYIGFDIS